MKRKKKYEAKKITLPTVLILFTTSITLLISIISTVRFVVVYKNDLQTTVSMNSQQVVFQTRNTLDIYISDMKVKLQMIMKELDQCQDEKEINEFINSMARTENDIAAILLFSSNGELLNYGVVDETLKENLQNNLSFDKKRFEEKEGIFISTPHVQNLFEVYYPWVVTVGEKKYSPIYDQDVYVILDIQFSSIASYIDNVAIGQYGYCYVIDNSGHIVYHPQQQMIFFGLKDENLEMVSSLPDESNVFKDSIYTLMTLEDGNWRVVGISYTSELISARLKLLIRTLAIVNGITISIAIVLMFIISKIITRPSRELIAAMKKFEKDGENFKYTSVHGVYEFQALSESFEHMVTIIQQLMEKVKYEEITLRKTELKALQAQINPHFLYNTLDSILWMCEQDMAKEAVKMVEALARLFRISISKGKELITIENELNHAKSYLLIQSIRYKNQFQYEFEVEQDIQYYLCNKITLQPLLENAIYHGINRMVEEGLIKIKVYGKEDDIVFQVIDNGIGMSEEKCLGILNNEPGETKGIGLKNVNDRVQIFFGRHYGLKIESEEDVGTTITVKFPKMMEGEYETK